MFTTYNAKYTNIAFSVFAVIILLSATVATSPVWAQPNATGLPTGAQLAKQPVGVSNRTSFLNSTQVTTLTNCLVKKGSSLSELFSHTECASVLNKTISHIELRLVLKNVVNAYKAAHPDRAHEIVTKGNMLIDQLVPANSTNISPHLFKCHSWLCAALGIGAIIGIFLLLL